MDRDTSGSEGDQMSKRDDNAATEIAEAVRQALIVIAANVHPKDQLKALEAVQALAIKHYASKRKENKAIDQEEETENTAVNTKEK